MLELYQFAHTTAVSLTPDRRFRREIEHDLMTHLRQRQRELVGEGWDPVLAGLTAVHEFEQTTSLVHIYPPRSYRRARLLAARDELLADPQGWAMRITGVAAATLATASLITLAAFILPPWLGPVIARLAG